MNGSAFLSNLFNSVSLGSILLLIALGLAITFGLMRVINMAHGEFIMAGAYVAFVTQNILKHCPLRCMACSSWPLCHWLS
jgi:urea transport system permease protein